MRKISFRDPLSEVYVDDNKVIRKIKKKDFLLFNDLFKQNFLYLKYQIFEPNFFGSFLCKSFF